MKIWKNPFTVEADSIGTIESRSFLPLGFKAETAPSVIDSLFIAIWIEAQYEEEITLP